MKIKKNLLTLIIYFFTFSNLYSLEPDIFVQSTVNRASKVLSDNISKERKIKELQTIAASTKDYKEGVSAFLDKRSPNYIGD